MPTAQLVSKEYDVNGTSITDLHHRIRADFRGYALSKRSKFRLVSEYVTWLRNGTKCTTVRYRPEAIDVPTAAELPLIASSGDDENGTSVCGESHCIGTVRITQIVIKTFGELSDRDACRDGFVSKQELREALQRLYSPIYAHCIQDDECISVYSIELL
jgi:hypothetical protein